MLFAPCHSLRQLLVTAFPDIRYRHPWSSLGGVGRVAWTARAPGSQLWNGLGESGHRVLSLSSPGVQQCPATLRSIG